MSSQFYAFLVLSLSIISLCQTAQVDDVADDVGDDVSIGERSGKLAVCRNNIVRPKEMKKGLQNCITMEFKAIKEVDAKGSSVSCGGHYDKFKRADFNLTRSKTLFQGIPVKRVTFAAQSVNEASFVVDVYIFQKGGHAVIEGEKSQVMKLDVLVTIELSDWLYCDYGDRRGTGVLLMMLVNGTSLAGPSNGEQDGKITDDQTTDPQNEQGGGTLQPGKRPSKPGGESGRTPPGGGKRPSKPGGESGRTPPGEGGVQPGTRPSKPGAQGGRNPPGGGGVQPGTRPSKPGAQGGRNPPGGGGVQPGTRPSKPGAQGGRRSLPVGAGLHNGTQPSKPGGQGGRNPLGSRGPKIMRNPSDQGDDRPPKSNNQTTHSKSMPVRFGLASGYQSERDEGQGTFGGRVPTTQDLAGFVKGMVKAPTGPKENTKYRTLGFGGDASVSMNRMLLVDGEFQEMAPGYPTVNSRSKTIILRLPIGKKVLYSQIVRMKSSKKEQGTPGKKAKLLHPSTNYGLQVMASLATMGVCIVLSIIVLV